MIVKLISMHYAGLIDGDHIFQVYLKSCVSNEFFLSRSKIFSRFSIKLQPTSSHLKQLMLCANKNAKVAAELMEQLRPGSNAHNYHIRLRFNTVAARGSQRRKRRSSGSELTGDEKLSHFT